MPDGPLFVPGSDGARINETVQPDGDEPVITKNFPNSFRETGLNDLLKEKGIEEVVIVGAMSHMCVDATVRAANDLGYKTIRSEEHTSELQSLMRISYAVFCLKK